MPDTELTEPVDLCLADGSLNPAGVGWSRHPLHRANLRGWGRTKRWEHWCVTTPAHLIALTVSDLDFLGLNAVHFLEYGGREELRATLAPPSRRPRLPEFIAGSAAGGDVVIGPTNPGRWGLRIEIGHSTAGTRLRARCHSSDGSPLDADLLVALPEGHETLSVVVPWNTQRFQYTSKHTARPASGRVRIGDREYEFGDDAWGTLDHGRGRWPRSVSWNWGSASGRTDGHTVGLQFGGKWTVGTGTTENALCIDGRLTRIDRELQWDYDRSDFLRPWTIRTPGSDQVDLTFTPFHNHRAGIDVGLLANRTNQCFGHYSGRIRSEDGNHITVERLLGWAEDVRMRW